MISLPLALKITSFIYQDFLYHFRKIIHAVEYSIGASKERKTAFIFFGLLSAKR